MTKKGSFQYTSQTFYLTLMVLPFVGLIFAAFYGISLDLQQGTVECVDIAYQESMMINSITSSNCLAYYDTGLDKTILGSIDMDKLTTKQLSKCFPFLGLSTLDNLKVGRVLDTSMSVSLGNIKVGKNVTTPRYVNKLVYVYQNGELMYKDPQSLQFEFEELQC